jgi:hypothetical protein
MYPPKGRPWRDAGARRLASDSIIANPDDTGGKGPDAFRVVSSVARWLRPSGDGTDGECQDLRGGAVKYMLLIYDNPNTREVFFGPQGADLVAEVDALIEELTESGELVGGEALADPSNTRTVRVRDGVPAVTDGPLAEAKEHFAGYLIVECETIERATQIAQRWPNARQAAMEVRPVMDTAGTEM